MNWPSGWVPFLEGERGRVAGGGETKSLLGGGCSGGGRAGGQAQSQEGKPMGSRGLMWDMGGPLGSGIVKRPCSQPTSGPLELRGFEKVIHPL